MFSIPVAKAARKDYNKAKRNRNSGQPIWKNNRVSWSVWWRLFFTLIVRRILQKEIVTRIIVSPPFGLTPFPFWDGLALRSANRFSLVLLVSLLYHRSDAVVYFISGNVGFKSFYVIFRSFFAMRLSPFAFGVTKKPDP